MYSKTTLPTGCGRWVILRESENPGIYLRGVVPVVVSAWGVDLDTSQDRRGVTRICPYLSGQFFHDKK